MEMTMDNLTHAAIQAAVDKLDDLIDADNRGLYQSSYETEQQEKLTSVRDDLQRLINPTPTRLRLGNPDWSRYGVRND